MVYIYKKKQKQKLKEHYLAIILQIIHIQKGSIAFKNL